jgi:hypothetical protein
MPAISRPMQILAEKIEFEANFVQRAARCRARLADHIRLDGIAEGLIMAAEIVRVYGDSNITSDVMPTH